MFKLIVFSKLIRLIELRIYNYNMIFGTSRITIKIFFIDLAMDKSSLKIINNEFV